MEMAHGKQRARATGALELIQKDFKKWPAGYGRHGFGNSIQLGREARSQAASQNNRFHGRLFPGRGGSAEIGAEIMLLDDHAEDMFQSQVCLLYVHGHIGGNANAVVAQRRHAATCSSAEADGSNAHLL
jgi:hypothetical protein